MRQEKSLWLSRGSDAWMRDCSLSTEMKTVLMRRERANIIKGGNDQRSFGASSSLMRIGRLSETTRGLPTLLEVVAKPGKIQ